MKDWRTVSFESLVLFAQNGISIRSGDGAPTVVLRLADVDSESWAIATESLREIGLNPEQRSKYALESGDLLVVRVNGSPQIAGRVVGYKGPPGFAYCDHFIRYRLNSSVYPPFVAMQFRHQAVRRQIESGMVSTAGQHTVSQRTFSNVFVSIPPLPEQHRIVAAIEQHFSCLDAAVASLERVKVNLKRARASVLKAAVEGRLVPTEAALAKAEHRTFEPASVLLARILEERRRRWLESGKKGAYKEPVKPETAGLPALPEGWVWGTPDAVSHRVTVGHVGSMKSEYAPDGVPFLRSQNVRANRFDWEGLLHIPEKFHQVLGKSKILPGDVLVVRSGSVGTACVLPIEVGEANCSDLVIIKQPMIEPNYLAYFLNSGARSQIEKGKVGVALIHFNTASVAGIAIPLPPLAEQHRIVAEVDRRLSVLDKIESSVELNLARCARLRQSILKRAFEGRLVKPEGPSSLAASAHGVRTVGPEE